MSFLAKIDWNPILTSEILPILCITGTIGAIMITGIIAKQIRKVSEVRLKEQMVLRGYSSEEIIEVMASGTGITRPGGEKPQRSFLRTPCC